MATAWQTQEHNFVIGREFVTCPSHTFAWSNTSLTVTGALASAVSGSRSLSVASVILSSLSREQAQHTSWSAVDVLGRSDRCLSSVSEPPIFEALHHIHANCLHVFRAAPLTYHACLLVCTPHMKYLITLFASKFNHVPTFKLPPVALWRNRHIRVPVTWRNPRPDAVISWENYRYTTFWNSLSVFL